MSSGIILFVIVVLIGVIMFFVRGKLGRFFGGKSGGKKESKEVVDGGKDEWDEEIGKIGKTEEKRVEGTEKVSTEVVQREDVSVGELLGEVVDDGYGEEEDDLETRINDLLYGSFLGRLLEDEGVTDIGYNGKDLWVKHNQRGPYREENQPEYSEVVSLVKKIANIQGKDITHSEPRLETEIGLLRVNAMHEVISPDGLSFAIRVSRPRLAISGLEEMTTHKSKLVEELIGTLIKAGSNIVISGVTGSGKTELQKLSVGYISDTDKITLIEDTRDSHIKDLYPEKNIDSWVTLKSDDGSVLVSMQDLLQSALRNDPDWVIVAETRGGEAADMLDAVKTGHHVITTLHADGAINIPSRLIPMIKQSPTYQSTDELTIGGEIVEMLRFGIHLDVDFVGGRMVRRIREIAEFTDYTERGVMGNYIYREVRVFNDETGEYEIEEEYKPLSEKTLNRLEERRLYHELPDVFKEVKGDKK